MKWIGNTNIKSKVLVMVVGTSLLLALTLGVIIWKAMIRMTVDNLQTRGIESGLHLAAVSSDFILTDDHYAIYQLITQAMAADDDIRYIIVMDGEMRIIAHSFSGGIPKGLSKTPAPQAPEALQVRHLTSDAGNIIDVLVPVENGDLGFVRIGMTEQKAMAYIVRQLLGLLAVTAGVCAGAGGVVYYLSWRFTRPLEQLAAVAGDIAQGNMQVQAQVQTADEIGKVAQAFNDMTAKLLAQSEIQQQLLEDKDVLLGELKDKEYLRDVLIKKLMTAQEDERKRISRELHDETSQALTSLVITLRLLAEECQDEQQQGVLYASRETAASILRDVRDLALELRPPLLDDMGLIMAIRRYVAQYEQKYPLKISFHADADVPEVDTQSAIALYRIVQEGLNNVAKHSCATAVEIYLGMKDAEILTLQLKDNGQGIKSDDLRRARQDNRIGLYGIQERVELLGGSFTLESDTRGTALYIALPLPGDSNGKEGEQWDG